MKIPSAFALLAALSAPAQADESNRTLSEAIEVAIEQCTAKAFGTSATLDGRIAVFMHAEGPLALLLQDRGMRTTAQLPDLIQRFVSTSRYSRLFGSGDVVAIGAEDGLVWLVETADPLHCDIGITGIEDAGSIAVAITDGVTAIEGWSLVNTTGGVGTWTASFTFTDADGAEQPRQALISVIGLAGETAAPDGIQAEINFAAQNEPALSPGS